MASNRLDEILEHHQKSLRRTLEAILTGGIYRNAGENIYEDTIFDLMDTLDFRNRRPEQVEHLVGIILAIFDTRNYPERGTLPEIEEPIHQMCHRLNLIQQQCINRTLSLYPWYNPSEH